MHVVVITATLAYFVIYPFVSSDTPLQNQFVQGKGKMHSINQGLILKYRVNCSTDRPV